MKITQIVALATLAVAGSAALADDPTVVVNPFTPQLTRAEVKADVLQAREQGQLNFVTEVGGQVNRIQDAPRSTLTRAEVRRDAVRSEPQSPVIYPLA